MSRCITCRAHPLEHPCSHCKGARRCNCPHCARGHQARARLQSELPSLLERSDLPLLLLDLLLFLPFILAQQMLSCFQNIHHPSKSAYDLRSVCPQKLPCATIHMAQPTVQHRAIHLGNSGATSAGWTPWPLTSHLPPGCLSQKPVPSSLAPASNHLLSQGNATS